MSLLIILLSLGPELSTSGPVERALTDLRDCDDIERPICKAVVGRLAAHGQRSVRPILKAFPALSPAGQLLAVVALQEIPHSRATAALVKLTRTANMMVRTTVVAALSNRHGPAVDKALVRALGDKSAGVRASAAEALGRLPKQRNARRVVPPLLKRLKDPVADVASAALVSAAILRDHRAEAHVLSWLRSEQLEHQKTGLFCLRFLQPEGVVPVLIELLVSQDTAIAGDASRTLARITGKDYGADYHLWRGWWDAEHESP